MLKLKKEVEHQSIEDSGVIIRNMFIFAMVLGSLITIAVVSILVVVSTSMADNLDNVLDGGVAEVQGPIEDASAFDFSGVDMTNDSFDNSSLWQPNWPKNYLGKGFYLLAPIEGLIKEGCNYKDHNNYYFHLTGKSFKYLYRQL